MKAVEDCVDDLQKKYESDLASKLKLNPNPNPNQKEETANTANPYFDAETERDSLNQWRLRERNNFFNVKLPGLYAHFKSKNFKEIFKEVAVIKIARTIYASSSPSPTLSSQLNTLENLASIYLGEKAFLNIDTSNLEETETLLAALKYIDDHPYKGYPDEESIRKGKIIDNNFLINFLKIPETTTSVHDNDGLESKETPKDNAALVTQLSVVFSKVTRLAFENCIMTEAFVDALIEAKEHAKHQWKLESIVLTNVTISPHLLNKLRTLVPPTTITISVHDNRITARTLPPHEKLDLKRDEMDIDALTIETNKSALELSELQKTLSSKKHKIKFMHNTFRDAIAADDKPTEFVIYDNLFGPETAISFANSLNGLSQLHSLNLLRIRFTDDNTRTNLLKAILQKKGLKHLTLEKCLLTDKDLELLIPYIQNNPTLISLSIRSNKQCSVRAFQKLIRALEGNTTLRGLQSDFQSQTLTSYLERNYEIHKKHHAARYRLRELKEQLKGALPSYISFKIKEFLNECENITTPKITKTKEQIYETFVEIAELFLQYVHSKKEQKTDQSSLDQQIVHATLSIENLCMIPSNYAHYGKVRQHLKDLFDLQTEQYKTKITSALGQIRSERISKLRKNIPTAVTLEGIKEHVDQYVLNPSTGIGRDHELRKKLLGKLRKIQGELNILTTLKATSAKQPAINPQHNAPTSHTDEKQSDISPPSYDKAVAQTTSEDQTNLNASEPPPPAYSSNTDIIASTPISQPISAPPQIDPANNLSAAPSAPAVEVTAPQPAYNPSAGITSSTPISQPISAPPQINFANNPSTAPSAPDAITEPEISISTPAPAAPGPKIETNILAATVAITKPQIIFAPSSYIGQAEEKQTQHAKDKSATRILASDATNSPLNTASNANRNVLTTLNELMDELNNMQMPKNYVPSKRTDQQTNEDKTEKEKTTVNAL